MGPRFPSSSASEYRVLWGLGEGACLFLRASSPGAAVAMQEWSAGFSFRAPEVRGETLALPS